MERVKTTELAEDGVQEFMFVLGAPKYKGSVQATINPTAIASMGMSGQADFHLPFRAASGTKATQIDDAASKKSLIVPLHALKRKRFSCCGAFPIAKPKINSR